MDTEPFDAMTDDAKLIDVLLRDELAHPAWWVAEKAGVERDYAEQTLRRMTEGDTDYPVLRRRDLGPDVYEATEESARQGKESQGR